MKKYTWLVAITLPDYLVAAGADLTDRRVHEMLCKTFPHATCSTIQASIKMRPRDELVAVEQGYSSTAEYLADRKKDS